MGILDALKTQGHKEDLNAYSSEPYSQLAKKLKGLNEADLKNIVEGFHANKKDSLMNKLDEQEVGLLLKLRDLEQSKFINLNQSNIIGIYEIGILFLSEKYTDTEQKSSKSDFAEKLANLLINETKTFVDECLSPSDIPSLKNSIIRLKEGGNIYYFRSNLITELSKSLKKEILVGRYMNKFAGINLFLDPSFYESVKSCIIDRPSEGSASAPAQTSGQFLAGRLKLLKSQISDKFRASGIDDGYSPVNYYSVLKEFISGLNGVNSGLKYLESALAFDMGEVDFTEVVDRKDFSTVETTLFGISDPINYVNIGDLDVNKKIRDFRKWTAERFLPNPERISGDFFLAGIALARKVGEVNRAYFPPGRPIACLINNGFSVVDNGSQAGGKSLAAWVNSETIINIQKGLNELFPHEPFNNENTQIGKIARKLIDCGRLSQVIELGLSKLVADEYSDKKPLTRFSVLLEFLQGKTGDRPRSKEEPIMLANLLLQDNFRCVFGRTSPEFGELLPKIPFGGQDKLSSLIGYSRSAQKEFFANKMSINFFKKLKASFDVLRGLDMVELELLEGETLLTGALDLFNNRIGPKDGTYFENSKKGLEELVKWLYKNKIFVDFIEDKEWQFNKTTKINTKTGKPCGKLKFVEKPLEIDEVLEKIRSYKRDIILSAKTIYEITKGFSNKSSDEILVEADTPNQGFNANIVTRFLAEHLTLSTYDNKVFWRMFSYNDAANDAEKVFLTSMIRRFLLTMLVDTYVNKKTLPLAGERATVTRTIELLLYNSYVSLDRRAFILEATRGWVETGDKKDDMAKVILNFINRKINKVATSVYSQEVLNSRKLHFTNLKEFQDAFKANVDFYLKFFEDGRGGYIFPKTSWLDQLGMTITDLNQTIPITDRITDVYNKLHKGGIDLFARLFNGDSNYSFSGLLQKFGLIFRKVSGDPDAPMPTLLIMTYLSSITYDKVNHPKFEEAYRTEAINQLIACMEYLGLDRNKFLDSVEAFAMADGERARENAAEKMQELIQKADEGAKKTIVEKFSGGIKKIASRRYLADVFKNIFPDSGDRIQRNMFVLSSVLGTFASISLITPFLERLADPLTLRYPAASLILNAVWVISVFMSPLGILKDSLKTDPIHKDDASKDLRVEGWQPSKPMGLVLTRAITSVIIEGTASILGAIPIFGGVLAVIAAAGVGYLSLSLIEPAISSLSKKVASGSINFVSPAAVAMEGGGNILQKILYSYYPKLASYLAPDIHVNWNQKGRLQRFIPDSVELKRSRWYTEILREAYIGIKKGDLPKIPAEAIDYVINLIFNKDPGGFLFEICVADPALRERINQMSYDGKLVAAKKYLLEVLKGLGSDTGNSYAQSSASEKEKRLGK